MKVYTLCVGNGADAGDWPELGDWYSFRDMPALIEHAVTLGLDTTWRNIDGNIPPKVSDEGFDPEGGYDCMCYNDDNSTDAVARVHVTELL